MKTPLDVAQAPRLHLPRPDPTAPGRTSALTSGDEDGRRARAGLPEPEAEVLVLSHFSEVRGTKWPVGQSCTILSVERFFTLVTRGHFFDVGVKI